MLTSKRAARLFTSHGNRWLAESSRRCAGATNAAASAPDYTPVYTFPYIKALAIIHKAKVYQTAASCVAVPASFALSVANVCSAEISSGIAALGISGCVVMHTLGALTSNTVGIVYLHKNQQTSKVSFLDGWGSRRDVEIPLKDIVPFSDQPASITDPLYLKLQQYNSKDAYKMNVRYGIVLNPEKFETIFHKTTNH